MKYTPANVYGDAGEHLVAAKVIKFFGFPCRLTNIDIGLDAEIEVIDEYFRSTGQFIKAQIKTNWQNKKMYVYVDGSHIMYWNSLNIPVVVFLVHLETEQIYWHTIVNIKKYPKKGINYKVVFRTKDLLSVNSKKSFLLVLLTRELELIRNLYLEAQLLFDQDREKFDEIEFDLTDFEHYVYNANKIRYKLDKAEKMLRNNPKLIELIDYSIINRNQIDQYLSKVNEIKRQAMIDHGENIFDALDSNSNNFD